MKYKILQSIFASKAGYPIIVTSELYYENFNKISSKLEQNVSKNINPAEFDIFITKHINLGNYDAILNMFLLSFSNQYGDDNLDKLRDSNINYNF